MIICATYASSQFFSHADMIMCPEGRWQLLQEFVAVMSLNSSWRILLAECH